MKCYVCTKIIWGNNILYWKANTEFIYCSGDCSLFHHENNYEKYEKAVDTIKKIV